VNNDCSRDLDGGEPKSGRTKLLAARLVSMAPGTINSAEYSPAPHFPTPVPVISIPNQVFDLSTEKKAVAMNAVNEHMREIEQGASRARDPIQQLPFPNMMLVWMNLLGQSFG
jgi:hypothetical protein